MPHYDKWHSKNFMRRDDLSRNILRGSFQTSRRHNTKQRAYTRHRTRSTSLRKNVAR